MMRAFVIAGGTIWLAVKHGSATQKVFNIFGLREKEAISISGDFYSKEMMQVAQVFISNTKLS